MFNSVYHLKILFFADIVNTDNITSYYIAIQNDWQALITFMDLVNCVLGPFLLMICFSSLLIRALFKSRSRAQLMIQLGKRNGLEKI